MTTSKIIFIISCLICILGCNPQINQIVNKKKDGKWITVDTLDYIYVVKGKYSNGNEVGTWKYFYNGKMERKEKYRKGICNATIYHPNGKIMKKGNTRFDSNGEGDHWYYFGKWSFYNTKGKLDSIVTYIKEHTTNDTILPTSNDKNQ